MHHFVVVGGIVLAIAGVIQAASRWESRGAPDESLLREGMTGFEGPDAEAVRAEFRLSGIALPERKRPVGFF
jgi:hypothetical protein